MLDGAIKYHYGQFPPSSEQIDWQLLFASANEATAALARYDQMLDSLPNSDLLLAPLRNQEAVASSRMEGTISTLDEVLQLEAETDETAESQTSYSASLEVLLFSRAFAYLEHEIRSEKTLNAHMIRSAHRILLAHGRGAKNSPGSFKTEQNYLGDQKTGDIHFIPISPIQLESGFQDWVKFNRHSELPSILKIALSHVEFEALHPFKDGNGRIGRMLIAIQLWQERLIRLPRFYISGYFEENKDEYVRRMRNVSAEGQWSEWCNFFFIALKAQADENIEVAGNIFELYEDMKEEFRTCLKSQWSTAALDYIFQNPVFTGARLKKKAGIPETTAVNMPRRLEEAGLIRMIRQGSGRRSSTYAFPALLNIVRR